MSNATQTVTITLTPAQLEEITWILGQKKSDAYLNRDNAEYDRVGELLTAIRNEEK